MRKEQALKLISKVSNDYDEISKDFSSTRGHPWYEFEIYKELIKSGDKVLDLGCGNGRFYDFINDMEVDYTGIDVSEGLLNIAASRFKGKKFLSKFRFKVGSFLDIPYKRPTFDKIFCIASFHHIPSKELRVEALDEMRRVLKKDGLIAISVWNLWRKKYRKYIWASLFRIFKYDFKDCFVPFQGKVKRYYHAFSLPEIRSLFSDSGFYIVEEKYVTRGGIIEKWRQADNFVFVIKPK